MKKMGKNVIKKEVAKENRKGITLIALVLTIVVLLILAGVSIATLTGDNGILTQAQNAKKQTEKASIDEQRKLMQIEASMNIAETEYNEVKIPAYCAPTRIEGESTIDDGLVIIDKNGNEWVWIEVPQSAMPTGLTFENATDYTTLETALINYVTEDYRQDGYEDTWYSEAQHGFASSDDYNTYKNNMLKSVYENGGFYIGRYEVGTQTARFAKTDDLTTPIITQDVYPYNYVTCKQAQTLSNQLAVGGKTSSLMFGIQWDLVMKYIEEKGKLSDGTTKITKAMLNSNSSDWGNYCNKSFEITRGQYTTYNNSTSRLNQWTDATPSYTKPALSVLLTTGATNRNSTLNIYDLAGNVFEWTLEQYTADTGIPCSVRGGVYYGSGGYYPASDHTYASTGSANYRLGFRPALY